MPVFEVKTRHTMFYMCLIPKVGSHAIRLTIKRQALSFKEFSVGIPSPDNHGMNLKNGTPWLHSSHLKWTVVRNPYARLYSVWFSKVRTKKPGDTPTGDTFKNIPVLSVFRPGDHWKVCPDISFEEFVCLAVNDIY